MPRGGEDAHVGANLGDDGFGAAPLNARDRAQQANGSFETGDAFLDRIGEAIDLLVKEVQVREARAAIRMSCGPCPAPSLEVRSPDR
jgi:hypothetical protein